MPHPRIHIVSPAAERARHADPDAAELRRTGQGRWLTGARCLAGWLAREKRLAEPWTPAAAAAGMIWSLMSPDLLSRLMHERRWSPRRIGDYLAVLLANRTAGTARQPPPAITATECDARCCGSRTSLLMSWHD